MKSYNPAGPTMRSQTFFETARGISSVEVAYGQALIVVSGIAEKDAECGRIEALRALAERGVSLDFLKLSPHGLSFILPEGVAEDAVAALQKSGLDAESVLGRVIVTVSAPNIRDESGLVAGIAECVVRSGAAIDHVGDMHSSVQIVVDSGNAEAAKEALELLMEEGVAV